jgi:PPP family 3-phenylpropionic acid transporter
LVYGSHALYDAFAVIRWSGAGLDASTISILWAEAVAAKVAVFFLMEPWLIDRIGARGAAVVAAVGGAVHWSGMSSTSSVLLLSLLQPLHGLTFAPTSSRLHAGAGECRSNGCGRDGPDALCLRGGPSNGCADIVVWSAVCALRNFAFLSMAALCLIAVPFAWDGLPVHAVQRRLSVSP